MPLWLARHLEDRGLLDTDGFTRAARAGRCRSCSALVLRGLDAERIALPATVDIDPVTTTGEVVALATGRFTYFLLREATSKGRRVWIVNRREAERIAARRDEPVHAEHRCDQPLPKATPSAATETVNPINDDPPF